MYSVSCPNGDSIRVLIVHEVRVLRAGLASLLLEWPELIVVDSNDQEDVDKRHGRGDAVDVVLLDAQQEAATVTHKILQIKSIFPDVKVIVIGVSGATSEILAYIEAGASAYTLLESSIEHLADTIHMVHRGEAACPSDVLALLFERITFLKDQLRSVHDNKLSKLTFRELEVLQLVSDGMSNKEIADHLKLELQTVKNYVHTILEKLRVRNRREATLYTRNSALPFVPSRLHPMGTSLPSDQLSY